MTEKTTQTWLYPCIWVAAYMFRFNLAKKRLNNVIFKYTQKCFLKNTYSSCRSVSCISSSCLGVSRRQHHRRTTPAHSTKNINSVLRISPQQLWWILKRACCKLICQWNGYARLYTLQNHISVVCQFQNKKAHQLVVYYTCYHLLRKHSCITVHWFAWASWPL